MRTLTLSQVRSPIARVLGVCTTDQRVTDQVNEAQERLLNRSLDAVGSWQRLRLCVYSGCIALPRAVRTIRAYWVCKEPGRFLSEWYESIGYDEGGWGKLEEDDCFDGKLMLDHGTACCFQNVQGATSAAPKKLQVVASNIVDNGKTITLRYVDANGNKVYTSIGGIVQEGEQLTLSTTGTLTASTVLNGGLYHVVKATTSYPVRVYSYDTVTLAQTDLLATYEPSETVPIYRRVLVPGISNMNGCNDGDDSSDPKSITILARLQHVPVVVDNDPLVIGNVAALKLMVQAIKYEEERLFQEAEVVEAKAMRELMGELAAYLGDSMQVTVRVPDDFGGGKVINAI